MSSSIGTFGTRSPAQVGVEPIEEALSAIVEKDKTGCYNQAFTVTTYSIAKRSLRHHLLWHKEITEAPPNPAQRDQ